MFDNMAILACLLAVIAAESAQRLDMENVAAYEHHFTDDFFSTRISTWTSTFSRNIASNKENELHVLEIGCFEGRSSIWFVENLLQHPSSDLTCIDWFEGSIEHNSTHKTGLYRRYIHNTAPFKDKVQIIRSKSYDGLLQDSVRSKRFDIIYIDGSHFSRNVLEDAILSFPLLQLNGVMIFDDYWWDVNDDAHSLTKPKAGIDAFLTFYAKQYKVVQHGYQLMIQKTSF